LLSGDRELFSVTIVVETLTLATTARGFCMARGARASRATEVFVCLFKNAREQRASSELRAKTKRRKKITRFFARPFFLSLKKKTPTHRSTKEKRFFSFRFPSLSTTGV
jgi:hypothetical protein